MMTTVLPTPAPPNKPILPPFRNGWIRSMTFTPVSNISCDVDCSSKAGAWRWMGLRLAVLTGPSLSTGLPMTLSTRPSVSRPTGTVMGPPRSMRFHAAHHAFGRLHGNAAHAAFAQLLLHFQDDVERRRDGEAFAGNAQRV